MAKPLKNILFTFDYELFLGSRSGTVENCVLIPTQKLLEIFNKHSLSGAIFFVDTTYLLKLKNNPAAACQEDYKKVAEQIAQIHRDGHYVFPHLHPHWLDAVYLPESNQWNLGNTTRYSFSYISEKDRKELFSGSMQLLQDICGPQESMGYRAGGWCIQPFSDFKPFFEQYNIRYDFTVMRGFFSNHHSQSFDFRDAPDKNFYHFSKDVVLEDPNGTFTEIPISTLPISFASRILNKFLIKFLYRKGITNYGDGSSTFSASMAEIKTHGHEMASLENLTLVNMSDYGRAISQRDYLQFISHPKMLTSFNLACLDQLLKKTAHKYDLNTDFKTFVSGSGDERSEKKKDKVLIISYVFPPYPGIGGRRWAKFAKYLNEKDVEVHVISAKNPFAERSVWNRDVKTREIRKTTIPHRYPTILVETPSSYLKRLQYKISLRNVETKARGSIYDRALFSEKDVLDSASEIIENEGITHVICTGAPFSILYYGTLLKKKYPHIKLMSDMRDPWTWGIAYGFGNMDAKKRAYEKELEEQVIETSDLVTVPVRPMFEHLHAKYSAFAKKIQLLPHGIDRDELPGSFTAPIKKTPGLVKLIYSGTVYPGAEKVLSNFSNMLLKTNNKKIEFNIYPLSKKEALESRFANTSLHIHNPVSPAALFGIISQHDYYVSFVTDQYKDFVSTKYFEIVSLKRPIILISPEGILSDFIVSNRIGKHFLPEQLDQLTDFLNNPLGFTYNKDFNLDEFMYDRLTDKVIESFIKR